jgi:hypothetical protein
VALLISKMLTELAYPLSLSLLLTLLGAVFVWRGQKRPAGLSLLCSLLVLWVGHIARWAGAQAYEKLADEIARL